MEITGSCELAQIYVIFYDFVSFFMKYLTHQIPFVIFNMDPVMIHQKQDKIQNRMYTLFISLNTLEKGDWIDEKEDKDRN